MKSTETPTKVTEISLSDAIADAESKKLIRIEKTHYVDLPTAIKDAQEKDLIDIKKVNPIP